MGHEHKVLTSLKVGLGIGVAYLLYGLLSPKDSRGSGPGNLRTRADLSLPRASVPAPKRFEDRLPIEIRVRPAASDPAKTVVEMEGKVITVGDLIARIDAGKRRDVRVTVRGDTREEGWAEIRAALGFAGIQIWLRPPP